MIDGEWMDEPCFIIGGGPSLIGFDFERLRGYGRIIAINRAYEFIPFADIHFFMDRSYYKRIQGEAAWQAFQGRKIYLNKSSPGILDKIILLHPLGRTGLSKSIAAGIYHGNNSGAAAIGLAYALGANPIYLLGYDCKRIPEHSYFHSGYGKRISDFVLARWVKYFNAMAPLLQANGTQVINLNPDSAIRCFPFSTMDTIEDARGQA